MADSDIFQPQPQLDTVKVRTERILKYVSRRLIPTQQAVEDMLAPEAVWIDRDLPSAEYVSQMLEQLDKSQTLSWLARSGLLENEVALVHSVRIYINGQLIREQDMT